MSGSRKEIERVENDALEIVSMIQLLRSKVHSLIDYAACIEEVGKGKEGISRSSDMEIEDTGEMRILKEKVMGPGIGGVAHVNTASMHNSLRALRAATQALESKSEASSELAKSKSQRRFDVSDSQMDRMNAAMVWRSGLERAARDIWGEFRPSVHAFIETMKIKASSYNPRAQKLKFKDLEAAEPRLKLLYDENMHQTLPIGAVLCIEPSHIHIHRIRNKNRSVNMNVSIDSNVVEPVAVAVLYFALDQDCVFVTDVVILTYSEAMQRPIPSQSSSVTLQRVTEQARRLAVQYSSSNTQFTALIRWLDTLSTLFTQPCAVCGHVLMLDGCVPVMLPPLVRLHSGGGEGEGEVTVYHDLCI